MDSKTFCNGLPPTQAPMLKIITICARLPASSLLNFYSSASQASQKEAYNFEWINKSSAECKPWTLVCAKAQVWQQISSTE